MRIIFFDIDGTLVLTNGAGKRALERTFHDDFGVVNANANIDYGGRTDLSIANELFALNKLQSPTKSDLNRFFGSYIVHLETELKSSKGLVLPGIGELLKILLEDSRYHLGIITGNIQSGANSKLGYYGLHSYFSFGGYGDNELDRDGIAREGFRNATQVLKKPFVGDQCVVIGDTPHDISCSRAINAFSIGVCTGYASKASIKAQNPHALFDDLSDTQQVLDTLQKFFS